jgi:hypothetical protein
VALADLLLSSWNVMPTRLEEESVRVAVYFTFVPLLSSVVRVYTFPLTDILAEILFLLSTNFKATIESLLRLQLLVYPSLKQWIPPKKEQKISPNINIIKRNMGW